MDLHILSYANGSEARFTWDKQLVINFIALLLFSFNGWAGSALSFFPPLCMIELES